MDIWQTHSRKGNLHKAQDRAGWQGKDRQMFIIPSGKFPALFSIP